MHWVIYALKHPRTNEVRYIGWTSRSIEARLQSHVNQSIAARQKSYKDRWILSLIGSGLIPLIEEVESGHGENWAEAERRWIAFYRAKGVPLVNTTDGGDGVVGLSPDQLAERAKKSHAGYANRSPEEKALTSQRHSESAKRRFAAMTPAQRSEYAKKHEASRTPEQRKAAGVKGKASFTFAQLSAIAKKRQSSLTPEQRSAAAKKGAARKDPAQRSAAARHAAQVLNAGLTREQRAAATLRARQARWGIKPPLVS